MAIQETAQHFTSALAELKIWDAHHVYTRIPEMTVIWVKVKAHRKREAEKYHEVINDEMDTLANTLHDNTAWQSKKRLSISPVRW